MTKTPQCAFCSTKEGVLVLRNGAMICPACRKGLRKYLGPELGKPICKRRAAEHFARYLRETESNPAHVEGGSHSATWDAKEK